MELNDIWMNELLHDLDFFKSFEVDYLVFEVGLWYLFNRPLFSINFASHLIDPAELPFSQTAELFIMRPNISFLAFDE